MSTAVSAGLQNWEGRKDRKAESTRTLVLALVPGPEAFGACVRMKNVTLRPAVVKTYECERHTFRRSVCLLCSSDRDPGCSEASRKNSLFTKNNKSVLFDGRTDKRDLSKKVNEDDDSSEAFVNGRVLYTHTVEQESL